MSARLWTAVLLALIACGGSETSPAGSSQDAGESEAAFDAPPEALLDSPADAPTNGVVALAQGSITVSPCAVFGDGRVACWGSNKYGQLGTQPADAGVDAGHVVERPQWVPGVSTAVQVVAGRFHACALLHDGSVTCWGDNGLSQLGQGTSAPVAGPTAVPGLDSVSELCAGSEFTCALRSGGVLCWGSDNEGQLGDGRYGDAGSSTGPKSATPLAVPGVTSVQHVACGGYYACALLQDGTARCWGYDLANELGGGSSGTTGVPPVVVNGLSGAQQIFAGYGTSYALVSGGAFLCWGGSTLDGVCGKSPPVVAAQLQPVQGISSVLQASGGREHACVLGSSGGVWCWGYNHFGQIGQGYVSAPAPKSDPVPPTSVPGLAGVVQVAAGYSHTCALLANHEVWCWGNIGIGTTSDSVPTPTKVTFPAQ